VADFLSLTPAMPPFSMNSTPADSRPARNRIVRSPAAVAGGLRRRGKIIESIDAVMAGLVPGLVPAIRVVKRK